ncbi:T9SS type A sorting domain-containing protein [candidate division KSB1 bacterium]|nr:T9SS type A sorting domain-containing protein [candidate division KSB1 bacterium]
MARFSYLGRLWVALLAVLGCGMTDAYAQDSLNVQRLSQLYDNWAIAEAVRVDGDILYAATLWNGLRVIDIADRTRPAEIAALDLGGSVTAITTHGATAYVGVSARLVCVNVTNPAAPQRLGEVTQFGGAQDLIERGGYLYAASGSGGLRIADVTNPNSPVVVGTAATRNQAYGVDLLGSLAFIADYESGLSIFDTSNPALPQLVGETTNQPGFMDVVVHDSVVYAAAGDGLHIIDATIPADPHEIGVFAQAMGAQALALRWPLLFVDCHYLGLYVFDCTEPLSPTVYGFMDTPEFEAWGVACDSTYAYLAAGYHGARIIDISDPEAIAEVAFVDTDYLQTTTIVDHFAYIAAGEYGLNVVDIADPRHPVPVGALDLSGMMINSVAVGNRLYTASLYSFSVVDISDPVAPVWINDVATSDAIWWIAHAGQYLYVAGGFGGLLTYDLADPDNPQEVYGVPVEYQLWSITLAAGYAYGTAGEMGLIVFDLSDPAHPVELTQFHTVYRALFAAVDGDRAYVTVEDHGFAVIDISDPAHPALIRRVTTRGFAGEIHVANGLLYVADQAAGFSVYSLWNRDLPELVAFYDTPTNCVGLTIVDTLVYVADWLHWGVYAHADGLAADDRAAPALPRAPALRACYPNPFNLQLQIEFELPQTEAVTLTIHDVLGRETAVLADGLQPAGARIVTWDAGEAASGVYFVKLRAGEYRAVRKVCLLR